MLTSWLIEAVLQGGRMLEAKRQKLSLDEIMCRVSEALRERFATRGANGELGYGVWPIQTFDDSVIYRNNGKTFSINWKLLEDGTVELGGDPTEVVQRYVPIKESAFVDGYLDPKDKARIRVAALILGPVAEAEGQAPNGAEWDVILIREGMSKNRNKYGRKPLAKAAPMYEGRPMFVDHKLETGPFGRSGNEVVGFTKNVRGVVLTEVVTDQATKKESATHYFALAARAGLIDESFRTKLLEAHRLGNPDLFGLSHDVRAESVASQEADGRPFYDVREIKHVESTDWVLAPSAGGRVLRLVASDTPHPLLQEDVRMLQQLIESLKKAGVTVPENCDEATATRLLNETLAARAATPAGGATTVVVTEATRTPGTENADLLARMVALEATNKTLADAVSGGARSVAALTLDRCLLECSLPDPFKNRIRQKFTKRIEDGKFPTETEIAEDIKAYVDDVSALREANLVMPHVGRPRVELVKDRADKMQERIADFFDTTKPLQSFKELYVDITGDAKVNGKVTEAVRQRLAEYGRLSESMTTTSFDQILGDSITRRMLKDYADAGLATWRGTVAEVVPLSDFRTVRRMRFGGYGNLPIVTQGSAYTGLTSPTDEEATYSPAKRGGTEQITLEMVKNDDVGAIRRIPSKLARAAAQTLHEFVWDFLNTNAAIYDTVALAAAGHGNNIVTTALSGANVSSLRLKIKQQTDMSNGKRIGLAARYLVVPTELEELAFQLTTSDRVLGSNNNDPNFVKKLNLTVIVVEYWTDTNNYWVTASIDQAPMLEIGFLDGQETPELFVQDLPSVGSMFSNDALTWKIRHIYGGAVMDFRPFAGAIVP